jgi:hypothetical protein
MSDLAVHARRARWAVAAIFFSNGSIVGTWAAHIPVSAERLDISHSVLGIALLMMALGALIAMPLGGMAIGRFGSAAMTRMSAIALCAAFPLPLIAPDPVTFMVALFIFGAFNGVLDVSMNAHGVLVEGRLARPVMSSFHGMWSLGGLAGAGFAAALLPLMPALAQAFLALAICTAIAVAALFFLLPSAADGSAGGPAFALPNRLTLTLGVLCFLCMMAEGAITDWAALHLKGTFALGAGPAATGFAAFSAAMAASRFGGDWLRGHIGAVALVRGSALLAAAGLSVALLVPAPVVAIAGYAIVGLGLGNLVPIFFGAAGRIPGERPGTAIAAVATVGYTGFLVGPPVIGFIADATALTTALGILVVGCLASALAAGAVAPAERHGLAAAR